MDDLPRALAFEAVAWPPRPGAPRLTAAGAAPIAEVVVRDETGAERAIALPTERALAVYVDRREVVVLMTLGAAPELLVLGWLLNQGLVASAGEVEAVTVDWEVGAAAVATRGGAVPEERLARRTVTTGCGQGTVFGAAMDAAAALRLPPAGVFAAEWLPGWLEALRARASVHRAAGSVHGCALFRGPERLVAVEDVGRHNAIDTIAGWMATRGVDGADGVLVTTGRLTSEMVLKAARMGLPVVVSRNGATALGVELARRVGMTLVGRAGNRRFLCYAGHERIRAWPAAPQRA